MRQDFRIRLLRAMSRALCIVSKGWGLCLGPAGRSRRAAKTPNTLNRLNRVMNCGCRLPRAAHEASYQHACSLMFVLYAAGSAILPRTRKRESLARGLRNVSGGQFQPEQPAISCIKLLCMLSCH